MIYPQNFEQKIGFDKIKQLIKERCLSPLGLERVDSISFSNKHYIINKQLNETLEFTKIISEEDEFPDNYFFDVRQSVKRIKIDGTYLDESEMFDLRRSLDTIKGIISFLNPADDEDIKYPYLKALTKDIATFPQLISQIGRAHV